MSPSAQSDLAPGHPGARFDPYVRLIRSLLPHTSCVTLFGAAGEFCWSTDTAAGPDLTSFVDHALSEARADPEQSGQRGLFAGNLPVYLWPLRDEAQQLLAILAVVCDEHDVEDFSLTQAQLAPLLECLARELRLDSRRGAALGVADAVPSRCAPEDELLAWCAAAQGSY